MRSLGTELRTLTSSFSPVVRLTLTSRDGLTTYVHCSDDFISMGEINWEMPFTGGFGKPSSYKVDISLPLDDIKTRLSDYNRAEANLRIDVAGQNFHPHIGRVKKIQRDGFDPNRISLTIVDRFLDDNPLLPIETIADSYTGTHLEEIGPEDGYPLYYGRHHRPFYFTTIDCHVNELLGPRNVSSESHINSVWFNSDISEGDDLGDDHILIMEHSWKQQSGSTNLTTSSYPFLIKDVRETAGELGDNRLWEWESASPRIGGSARLEGEVIEVDKSRVDVTTQSLRSDFFASFIPKGLGFHKLHSVEGEVQLVRSITGAGTSRMTAYLTVSSEKGFKTYEVFSIELDPDDDKTFNATFSYNVNCDNGLNGVLNDSSHFNEAFGLDKKTRLIAVKHSGGAAIISMFADLTFQAQLKSKEYEKFSIFSPVVNSSALACVGSNDNIGGGNYIQNQFEGFIGTLDHIFSFHTSTPFVTSQSSLSQKASIDSGFLPQCFFAVRRELTEIIDEFGKVSATNMWIGDSGMVNYRTYQESANATVDRTITGSDIELKSFDLIESPIGGHLGDHEIFDRISVKFGYHFQKGQYEKSARAYPANNAMCNSVNAAGVVNDFKFETEYITDPDVASYFLGNLVRLYAQGKETIEFSGGANLFDIELGDVLKVQNPIIVGSESLYQVVRVSMNPIEGKMKISATQLIAGGLT